MSNSTCHLLFCPCRPGHPSKHFFFTCGKVWPLIPVWQDMGDFPFTGNARCGQFGSTMSTNDFKAPGSCMLGRGTRNPPLASLALSYLAHSSFLGISFQLMIAFLMWSTMFMSVLESTSAQSGTIFSVYAIFLLYCRQLHLPRTGGLR